MVSLTHLACYATLMLAGGIFIPIFVVRESAEVAVTLADDLDRQLDRELKPREEIERGNDKRS